MSKTILANVDGFTPCIDIITQEYGIMVSAVFGRVWRYCQMDKNVCDASIETIAANLNVSYNTVVTHIETLVKGGYLVDLDPNLRNRPHRYADTGKAGLTIAINSTHQNLMSGSSKFDEPTHQNLEMKIVVKKETKKGIEEEAAPPLLEGVSHFLKVLGAKRLNPTQRAALEEIERTYGTDKLREMSDWCALHGMNIGKSIQSIKTAAPTWGQKNGNGNKRAARPPAQAVDPFTAALEAARKGQPNGNRK